MKNSLFACRISIITGLIFTGFIFFPILSMAQDPGGDPDAPIDGGLSLLLAAGTAYGVKKYRDYKKSSEDIHL